MYNIINKFEIRETFSEDFLDNLSEKIIDKIMEDENILKKEDALVGGTAFHDVKFENTSMTNVWVDYMVTIKHKNNKGDLNVTFERIIIYDEIPDQVLDAINQHKNIDKIIENNIFDERLSVLMEERINKFKAKFESVEDKKTTLTDEYYTINIFLLDEEANPQIVKYKNGKKFIEIENWGLTLNHSDFNDIQNYLGDYIDGNMLSIIHYVTNPPELTNNVDSRLFAMFVLQYREWLLKTYDIKEIYVN
jgi:hypothetical protein